MLSPKPKLLSLCLLISSLLVAEAALANVVGTVIFKAGDVSVTHLDKTVVDAAKNSALNAGDTIETRDGRVQFSLIDGGKVSLQPNTIYKINKYEFSGKEDGSEYAFTELLKGGLRTVSGLIGHKNRDRYQLKTAVATIGIRGTEFTVNFDNNNLLMTTNHGSVDVCALTGACLNAISGQTIAVSAGSAPAFSSKAAKAAAAAPAAGGTNISPSEQLADNGSPKVITTNVAVAGSQAVSSTVTTTAKLAADTALYVVSTTSNGVENDVLRNTSIQAEALNGKLTSITYNSSATDTFALNATSLSHFNTDGIVAWGQVNNGTYSLSRPSGAAETNDGLQVLDYIVGVTPNPTNLATLTGHTYNVLIGSTAPFMVSCGCSGSMNSTTTIGLANTANPAFLPSSFNFNFTALSFGYSINVSTSTLGGFQLIGGGSLTAGDPTFKSNGSAIVSTDLNCGIGCTAALNGGTTLVQGSLFGANGERVGLQYGFNVPNQGAIYGGLVLGPLGSRSAF